LKLTVLLEIIYAVYRPVFAPFASLLK